MFKTIALCLLTFITALAIGDVGTVSSCKVGKIYDVSLPVTIFLVFGGCMLMAYFAGLEDK